MTAGQTVLPAGSSAQPERIGALAAIGLADVDVYAKPRVAIVSTGNEIVQPGEPLQPGQIYDINRFTLSAIVNAHGGISRAGGCRSRQPGRPAKSDRDVG